LAKPEYPWQYPEDLSVILVGTSAENFPGENHLTWPVMQNFREVSSVTCPCAEMGSPDNKKWRHCL